MNIQQRTQYITALGVESNDPRALAVAVEANQNYLEYLDELLDGMQIDTGVTVKVDGVTIKFKSVEDMAAWITSNK